MSGADMREWRWEGCEELAREAEAFETPHWAIESLLDVEILTPCVVDPCCGDGRMHRAAEQCGYEGYAYDKYDWGYRNLHEQIDFLTIAADDTHALFDHDVTYFMNPPFSLAPLFVDHAFNLGARKVVMFQRFAFYESNKRRAWFNLRPPSRIWLCGARADCWRIDIPPWKRGVPKDKGGAGSSTPTAHAWFVFERGHLGTQTGRIYPPAVADD